LSAFLIQTQTMQLLGLRLPVWRRSGRYTVPGPWGVFEDRSFRPLPCRGKGRFVFRHTSSSARGCVCLKIGLLKGVLCTPGVVSSYVSIDNETHICHDKADVNLDR
jgi:hypothetical protein